MSERMKYNCEACGAYVEAGGGHTCYTPSAPQTEIERVQSLCDSYRRDLDRERGLVRELEADLRLARETVDRQRDSIIENQELRATIAELKEAAREAVTAVRFQRPENERAAIDALAALLEKNDEN